MSTRKLQKALREGFGAVPDPSYFDGDMASIRAYYDYRRDKSMDDFLIDDITWNDLDMDRVFRRINPRRCSSGEQVLYHMLRSPAISQDAYEARWRLVHYAEANPERRLRLETILARLGCTRRADLYRIFAPEAHGIGRLLVYLCCLLLLVFTVAAAVLPMGLDIRAVLLALLLNFYVHEFGKRKSQRDYDTVNYVVSMIFAAQKLRKLGDRELDAHMAEAYAALDRLQAVIRTGGVSRAMDSGGLEDMILSVTLLDLISYEFIKNKLGRCHDAVFTIHEHLGRLDAAISIASYRASLACWAEPELTFDCRATTAIHATGLYHPLLETAVPNPLMTERSLLITGSNASGKSTYLKTAALAAIMAQSICTVCGQVYRGRAFRIYSSMAVSDDLLAGESYYLAELRATKRIFDGLQSDEAVLCVVDEVLRGTNTVERIAASAELLTALADAGALCLAATHDLELCTLLKTSYRMFHFKEQISHGEIHFDYTLQEGTSSTRNAIELLRLVGFNRQLVENAYRRAARYEATGSWI